MCAWSTLDETNRYQTVVTGGGAVYVLALPAGSYDLDAFADALETALVQELGTGYKVERTGLGSTGSTQSLLRVSHPSQSFMLAESPLSKIVTFPQLSSNSHTSGFVDLRRVHNIFVKLQHREPERLTHSSLQNPSRSRVRWPCSVEHRLSLIHI